MTYRKENILDELHWRIPDYKQRMEQNQWKKLLLHDDDKIIFRGNVVQLQAKNLGYGIVEVSKENI